MSDPGEAARRRRRLAALGGTPGTASSDETGLGWSEPAARDGDDDIRHEVPPHHG